MQLAQTFSPGSVLGTAVGSGFQSNCSPSPLCLPAEVGAGPRAQVASREALPIADLALEEEAAWVSRGRAPLEGSLRSPPVPGARPQPKVLPSSSPRHRASSASQTWESGSLALGNAIPQNVMACRNL